MKKQIGIVALVLVLLAVMASGCITNPTPQQNTTVAPSTPAPAAPTQTTTKSSSSSNGADINPVDGTIGTYMGVFSGYPGYRSSDGSIIWLCDAKNHFKMYGYMSDFEANGNQWKDSDLTTVTWNPS